MKTLTLASTLSPAILVMLALVAAVTLLGFSSTKLPVLSSLRADIVIVLVLGFAMCTMGGLKEVGAAGLWAHPLAILGIVLGILILLVGAAGLFGFRLPLITGEKQTLVAAAVLIGLKVLNSVVHSLLR